MRNHGETESGQKICGLCELIGLQQLSGLYMVIGQISCFLRRMEPEKVKNEEQFFSPSFRS